MRTIFCLATTLIPAGILAGQPLAQGPVHLETAHYGRGCNPVFQQPPEITAGLDSSGRVLTITVDGFPGCCNTFLVQRLIAFGFGPAQLPLPWFGAGCKLLVDPLFTVVLPAPSGSEASFLLPPGLPPLTFYTQGALHYFTTIGFTHDLAFTDGMRVTLF